MAIKTISLGSIGGGEGFVFTPKTGVKYKTRKATYTFLVVKNKSHSGEVWLQTNGGEKATATTDTVLSRTNVEWVEFSEGIWKVAIVPTDSYAAAPPLVPLVMPASSSTYGARDWLRKTLSERGLDYRTVTEVPFAIDSSRVTDMTNMFQGCSKLEKAPVLDTRNVRNMSSMFQGCAALREAPTLDTRSLEFAAEMFSGCSSLVKVPDMNTAKTVGLAAMFQDCAALTDGNVRLIGKNPEAVTMGMIDKSGLTREPFFDKAGKPI